MEDHGNAPSESTFQKPTEEVCRDGSDHDWKLVTVAPGYSYYFCQKCGFETGRPKNPTNQCPP